MTEKMRALMKLHEGLGAREQRDNGARGCRGLGTVPKTSDDSAHQGGQVGAPHAEGGAGQDGIRHARFHPREANEVHQRENDQRAETHREDEVQEVAAQQKEACREIVSP